MKKVYINRDTETIVIVSLKNDLEYQNNKDYIFLYEGYKKDSLKFIENYWEENLIYSENQQFITD